MVDADKVIDDVDLEKFDTKNFPQTVTADDKCDYDGSGAWISLKITVSPPLRMGIVTHSSLPRLYPVNVH